MPGIYNQRPTNPLPYQPANTAPNFNPPRISSVPPDMRPATPNLGNLPWTFLHPPSSVPPDLRPPQPTPVPLGPGPKTLSAAPKQTAIPGATAGGSQIDRPGGLGGYAAGAPQSPQDAFFNLYTNDEILNAQRTALNAGLSGYWGSQVLPQAAQAFEQLGYNPHVDPAALQASLAGLPQAVDLSGNPIPGTIGASLMDPAVLKIAQENPYSEMAGISKAADEAAWAAAAGAGGSGGGVQGARLAQEGAQQSIYDKTNAFMSGLNTLYGNYLDKLSAAQGTLGTYDQAAQQRIADLIKSGWITAQTKSNATPAASPAEVRGGILGIPQTVSHTATMPGLPFPAYRPSRFTRQRNMPGPGPRRGL